MCKTVSNRDKSFIDKRRTKRTNENSRSALQRPFFESRDMTSSRYSDADGNRRETEIRTTHRREGTTYVLR